MQTHPIDFYSPEAVEMVLDKYISDLDAARSGTPYALIDVSTPAGRDQIRMLRIHLSAAEIADTYRIHPEVVRVILKSRRETPSSLWSVQ
jgi:hypothetical protein